MTLKPDLPTCRVLGNQPASISGSRASDRGAELLGEFFGDLDVVLGADAATDGDQTSWAVMSTSPASGSISRLKRTRPAVSGAAMVSAAGVPSLAASRPVPSRRAR